MANIKISELTAAGALTGTELIEIVQDGTNVQTTAQDIADLAAPAAPDTIYTADGTLGGNRAVTIPATNNIMFSVDADNQFIVGDDGGFFAQMRADGDDVLVATTASFQIIPDTTITGALTCQSTITGLKAVTAITFDAILDGQSGTVYTNTGAGADITLTLPDAAIGTEYTFLHDSSVEGDIIINTVAGISANVGGTFMSDTVYGTVTNTMPNMSFIKVSATLWVATNYYGGVFFPI